MESLNNRLKNSGQTFETSSDLRIPKTKMTLNPNAFADYGQTIGTSSKKIGTNTTRNQTRTNKFKPSLPEQRAQPSTGLHRRNVDKPKPQSEDELSADEMDLFSEASRQSDPSSPQNLVTLSRKPISQAVKPTIAGSQFFRSKGKPMEEANFVDSNGKEHQYDPKFPPVNPYANLSFKKTAVPKTEFSTVHPVLPLSTSPSKKGESISKENSFLPQNGPSLWSPIRTDAPKSRAVKGKGKEIDLTSSPRGSWDDNEVAPLSPLSGKSANSNRTASPPPRSSLPVPGRNTKNSYSGTDGMENLRKPPGKERPKPVPVRKGAHKATAGGGLAKFGYGNVANAVGTRSRPRQRSSSLEVSSPRRKEKSSPKLRPTLKPAPFPVTLDSIDFLCQPEVTDSKKDLATPRPFPMLENLTGQKKLSGGPSKGKAVGKGTVKARNIVISEDEDGDEDEDEVDGDEMVPKAFPMSISSIGSSPGSSRPSKRNSDYGSDDDRISKKSRIIVESPAGSSSGVFDEEGDSMSLDSGVKHAFLCPFCDTPLPAHPSPLLLKLLEETKKKARPDPRPSNTFGLRAPLAIYITTCQRHRFESKILPEAEKRGWPKTINWKKVSSRILKMKDFLQALIDDSGDDLKEVPSSPSEYEWEVKYGRNEKDKKMAKGPKASSIVWMELMKEIEKKGLRAVSGVHGQFASFERAQPGYYGELGAVIIYQTLYNMFPPTEMDPDLVSPLTPTEFIQRILVPEVALHLIIEDQNLKGEDKMEDALQILRDSSSYGVAMFPEDGGEFGDSKRRGQEKMGEGDLIVMERARKRRKELKEEEEREEEERRLQEENEILAAEKSKKAQKARKERQPSVAESIEVSEPVQRPRPKPVPITKSRAAIVLPPPAKEGQPESSGRSTRSRSRSTCNGGSDSEKDSGRRPSSEERRRSPSASEYIGPKTYRRSPSHDMARLRIYCGDSDSSTDAVVNGEGRPRSRARSIAASSKGKGVSRKTSEVSDSDSIIEVVENAKTPLAKRQCPKYAIEDDTPRPPQRVETPPLFRARKRLQSQQDKAVLPAKQQSTSSVKKADSFSWVIDSSDSS